MSPEAVLCYMGREGGTRWERPRALLLFTDEESEAYLREADQQQHLPHARVVDPCVLLALP